jgi:hypothetical protein
VHLKVVGYSPDSNQVSAEAEESPLLEAITKERMKTQQAEKTVICKVWRSSMAL